MLKMILSMLAVVSFYSHAEFDFKVDVLADDLQRPWGISHIGSGKMLITERDGDVRLYDGKTMLPALQGLPSVYNVGQGGLLDVYAHPNYASNKYVYFTFGEGTATKNYTKLIRTKFTGSEFVDVKTLFMASPTKKQALHYAGRISFLADNSMVFGVGDGYLYKEQAQELNSHLGKIIRLYDDGSIPADNPFIGKKKTLHEIYSYGHRNPQGMFFDNKRKILFSNEHGPKGGDEINIIQAGKNYGWPAITYGVDYSGDIISDLTHKAGMEQPLLQWTPSIAPSSMLVYYGAMFPDLNGHILATALKFTQMRVVRLNDKNGQVSVVKQEVYLKDRGERIRDIELDDVGRIYLITDSGKLLRLTKP
ncbi:PQQ-dependent sugar dehydrogenase [Psychrosphaera sp. B3R10]|uniref:PQQ-dependent sugar dehydrogenase n=1 Tax=unclassified Psychrosphaera TaxID=2641570 RepID=UPI001C08D938|nr:MULTISPECIES: PQQ-dependent sugar dehydrogenase [unclassified Psychrosphaera]MBU2880986.1 PQQ-dependent sugar dehydrogenase [Psychrosphaera sp. I2R16]MBU2990795.1 PQQ-dependent sugar dehydrogenase [Psychrosphaera sp. B3R10]